MLPRDFYIVPEDVFRLGNSTSPRMAHVRSTDVDTMVVNDIVVVIANGKGVSVFDKKGIEERPETGWVWRLSFNVTLPTGLKLVNDRPHHYTVAPTQNMPVDKYKGLLEELGLKAVREYCKKKAAQ
jgi:hypothetical protein